MIYNLSVFFLCFVDFCTIHSSCLYSSSRWFTTKGICNNLVAWFSKSIFFATASQPLS